MRVAVFAFLCLVLVILVLLVIFVVVIIIIVPLCVVFFLHEVRSELDETGWGQHTYSKSRSAERTCVCETFVRQEVVGSWWDQLIQTSGTGGVASRGGGIRAV